MRELGLTSHSYGVCVGESWQAPLKRGDVVGFAYDQAVFPVRVDVWHNGSQLDVPLTRGLKGEQWPALFVGDCTVDWALDEKHWRKVWS